MTSAVRLGALGSTVEVRLRGRGADRVAARLRDLWHLCPADTAATVDATVDLDVADVPRVTRVPEWPDGGPDDPDDLDHLLQVATVKVTEAALDAASGSLLMLHAACLADARTGRAVAFVAPGGTGKTTLVRRLGPRHRYVTDEATAVRDDGVVVPYPKPLSLRRTADGDVKTETAPGALGLRPPDRPVRLGAVCLLDRRDDHRGGATAWSPGTLDAVAALVPHTSHLVDLERPLQRLADVVESTGGLRVLAYSEAADLGPVVARLLEGS